VDAKGATGAYDNPALDFAVETADSLNLPLFTVFALTDPVLPKLIFVETDAVVPPRIAYPKLAWSAPWARKTLESTFRENAFSKADLESANTDDPYWNAAQLEMILTGKMHNYMRMYWGKKILSWFRNLREAYSFAIELNDRYSLDGRDPNGYAGVAWCFGRHDRPWPHRDGFGSVRSMTPEGLRRKFDADLYAERMQKIYNARIPEVS